MTSSRLLDSTLALAWSHWVGLGVRGTARPPMTAVDPEALLYLTACLADHDPRLRDEVGDWWKRYERHVSRARLTSLASAFDDSVVAKFDKLERAYATLGETSEKSHLDRLDTPARTLIRLRCVFGSNARAEILHELLVDAGHGGKTALALASVGYSKRNVAFVLDDLVMAGLISKINEGNRAHYRVADSEALSRVLRPLPHRSGRWHLRFPIIASFIEVEDHLRKRDISVQGVEARKLFLRHKAELEQLGFQAVIGSTVETYWATLQDWLVDNLIADRDASTDHIAGMLEGVWLRPGEGIRRPQRLGSAVLPEITANPATDRQFECLDLVQVPTIDPPQGWAWAVLSTAGTNVYAHAEALRNGEDWRFVTWIDDEPHQFRTKLIEPIEHRRIAKRFGKEAVQRARIDRPALRLLLERDSES